MNCAAAQTTTYLTLKKILTFNTAVLCMSADLLLME